MTAEFSKYDEVIDIACRAGDKIMEIYIRDFEVYDKADNSPLTEADLASHQLICEALKEISDLPILSEESASIDWEIRRTWTDYWLIDPLDGTKEFVKKNGEFTVNIALISKGVPVFGVVYAPAIDTLYWGIEKQGAWVQRNNETTSIKPRTHVSGEKWKIVGSRSHQSPEIKHLLALLNDDSELVAMGSSLKLCLVAEGAAHLYPRVGPTSEWDTAAAHGVALAAGAEVTILDPDNPLEKNAPSLKYNQKDSILNPYFMVSAR